MVTVRYLAAITMALLVLLQVGCMRGKEVEAMDQHSAFLKSVDSLKVDDEDGKDKFAASIIAESMEKPRRAVELVHSSDAMRARKGRALVLRLGGLATEPLMSELKPDDADKMIWDLNAVTNSHLDNEARLVKKLRELLQDKRPLTVPPVPANSEEKHPPRRVCDETYLMLRKLLAFEAPEAEMMNTREYLYRLTDRDRDAEIKRFAQEGTWTSLMERVEERTFD